MHADFSLELTAEDPALELPWRPEDGSVRYLNLKLHPDLVLNVPEARSHPELSAFLSRMNAASFPLETAKCDAWLTGELAPEDEIFGAQCKFVCYVDLLFSDEDRRFSLPVHEQLVENLCGLLKRAPEMAAAAEFVIRHCHYHVDSVESDSRLGFCITAYVNGYGDSEDEALERWRIALKLVQHALVQVAAANRALNADDAD
jgi:hypothetical protein